MKKNLIKSVTIGALLFMVIIASATNPLKLVNLLPSPPTPLDSVQVTIDLEDVSCESLECCVFEIFTDGSGGSSIIYGPYLWGHWATFTTPWINNIDPSTLKICVHWHQVSPPTCSPVLPDKTCCVRYTGIGQYNIPCNPCIQ